MTKTYKILVVNPGSTSTKLGLFANDEQLADNVIRHNREELAACPSIIEQKDIRLKYVLEFLAAQNVTELDAIVGIGGLVKPISSGTYIVNENILHDLVAGTFGMHASCLGGVIADLLGKHYNAPAYIVDPVVVDELEPIARISGLPGMERRSIFHALNAKSVARECAADLDIKYENARFVVAHMGGGISIGAHCYGRVIDVNNALNGEGPFSPERTGSLPLKQLVDMCFEGKYTKDEILHFISRQGGMLAYIGTNDLMEAEKMIDAGDANAALIVEAMAYQVAKDLGAMVAVLEGVVDGIVLTGGLAYSNRFTGYIKQRVDKLAEVYVYPGENELKALAQGALRVLRGEEKAAIY
jgi:butyrate kinase